MSKLDSSSNEVVAQHRGGLHSFRPVRTALPYLGCDRASRVNDFEVERGRPRQRKGSLAEARRCGHEFRVNDCFEGDFHLEALDLVITAGKMIRRAKAKLFDGKQEQDFLGLPSDAPQTLAAAYDPELNVLLHEPDREFCLRLSRGRSNGDS